MLQARSMLPQGHLQKLQETVFQERPLKKVANPNTQKALILEIVCTGASLSAAARSVGISRQTLVSLLESDQQFAADVEDADNQGSDYLEDLALIRAHESDTILLRLLEARRPNKFSSKRQVNANVRVVIQSLKTPPVIEGEIVDEQIQISSQDFK